MKSRPWPGSVGAPFLVIRRLYDVTDAFLTDTLRKTIQGLHLVRVLAFVARALGVVECRVDVDEVGVLEPFLRVRFQIDQPAHGGGIVCNSSAMSMQ